MAWQLKLKGCTVYRDGSRQEQVLNLHSTAAEESHSSEPEVAEQPEALLAKKERQVSMKATAASATKHEAKPSTTNFEEVLPPPVISEKREHVSLNKKEIIKSGKCPECHNDIQVAEGCMLCLSCGFSACSV